MATTTRDLGAHPLEVLARDGAFVRAIASAPERVVLAAVALALSAGAWVNLGLFHWWLVVPTAAAVTAACWRIAVPRERNLATARGSALALTGTIVWVILNVKWAAEYFVVRRDPGFLTLSGVWLADHPSTDMPVLGAHEVASLDQSLIADAPEAWNRSGDVVQPQGAKMLPAVLGIGGWLGGVTGVLTANIVVGAIGLLAVYALARRFMGPLAAMVPAIGLGLCLAHITLSRAAYTEPLTMLLVVAAIGWAWQGVEKGKIGPLLLAGVANAGTTMARIDGPSYAIGLAAGVAFALALSRVRDPWWRTGAALGFLGTQSLVVYLSNAGLERWSLAYAERLSERAGALTSTYELATLALAALVVIAAVVRSRWESWSAARARRSGAAASATDAARSRAARRWGVGAAGLTVAVWLTLASRPLWMTKRNPDRNQTIIEYVAFLQQQAGFDVDGTRTYAEQTVNWVALYLGWPLVILGIAGFAVMAYRALAHKPLWAIVLSGFMAPALLYLWRPSVVADQVWAIRRLSSSAVVGLIIAGAIAWQWAYVRLRSRLGATDRVLTVSLVLAAVVAMSPFFGWLSIRPGSDKPVDVTSVLRTKEQDGAREQLELLCEFIDGRPTVIIGTSSHFGTVRAGCDVPVVLGFRRIEPELMTRIHDTWGGDVVVITRNVDNVDWVVEPENRTFYSRMEFPPGSLGSLPRDVATATYHWYVGEVQADGTVLFLHGPGDDGNPYRKDGKRS